MSKNEAISRYDDIYNHYYNLAVNRFTWENLPMGLTSEQLEKMLIEYGELFGFKDERYGLFILPCFQVKELNVYGLPIEYNIVSLNGKYNEHIEAEKGVLLRNNPLGTKDIQVIKDYSQRIDDIERTQDVNLFQQNIPKIILTDENSKLTAKNLIEKVMEFKLAIFGRKSLSTMINTQDSVLDTTAPYLLDKLQAHRQEKENELLAYLGFNSIPFEKKERLIDSEVNANNDYNSNNLDMMFDLREKFANDFNKMFGTEIKVSKREVESDVRKVYSNDKESNRE